MTSATIEFAVQMTCYSCEESVKNSLQNVPGIEHFQIDLETQRVVIKSQLPSLEIMKLLESTGKKVTIKGYAGGQAAVSILEAGSASIKGVIRFIQATPNTCIIDGTVDGLKSDGGLHCLSIHECGDISSGCANVGDILTSNDTLPGKTYGDLGNIFSDENDRAQFRLENNIVKVSEIIGRSLVISRASDNNGAGAWNNIVCGVIARSAGLFQNPKTICACDGTTIWDEASKKSQL
ncbi:unnamed protein product [Phaedon cochleariae]|uniref:superoxide dismutase n=1 Tax=Phaedon cochleariae TaxID=80249 RepID=A0A9P0GJZ4_PHACE|nr:unnamed protein product [Phaedon cochleariae]